MPKFSIAKDGRPVGQVDAHGDRIELGSARTCQVVIDDLLISLKQAAFVKSPGTGQYVVEAVSRVPAFTLNGIVVEQPTEVPDGALLGIEGYSIKIEYLPGERLTASPAQAVRSVTPIPPMEEPPLPPPLEPDLPAPLEQSQPKIAAPAPIASAPVRSDADMERTVFVRRVGRLVATGGPLAGQHWDLKSGETRIGRESGQNDIVVRFDSQGNVDNSVSRRHASVHVIGDRIFVEDVGSVAGTFLNGVAVPARQRVEVKPQDVIEIRSSRESTFLRLELERSAAPSIPVAAPVAAPHAAPAQPIQAQPIAAEPIRAAAPRHEAPVVGDFGSDEPPPARRRRRESSPADNLFVPAEAPRSRGKIPTWGWVVAGAGIVLLVVILLLIAL